MARDPDKTRDAVSSAQTWIGIKLSNLFQASAWLHTSWIDLGEGPMPKYMRDLRLQQAAGRIAEARGAIAEMDSHLKAAADLIDAERHALSEAA